MWDNNKSMIKFVKIDHCIFRTQKNFNGSSIVFLDLENFRFIQTQKISSIAELRNLDEILDFENFGIIWTQKISVSMELRKFWDQSKLRKFQLGLDLV